MHCDTTPRITLSRAQRLATRVLNGHSRDGRPLYPCSTCGRGRMHTNARWGERAGVLTCPVCDGPSGLEVEELGVWAWKYGVPLRDLRTS